MAGIVAAMLIPGVTSATGASTGGGPVPANTRPQSVSFVSPSDGFLLGSAHCSDAPCTVILHTSDRGAHWVGMPAPRESVVANGTSGLSEIRFADARHGFAFGHGLWETTDGSASWHRLTGAASPGRDISDLEPVADRELVAITQSCVSVKDVTCPDRLVLSHSPLGAVRWTRVATAGLSPSSGVGMSIAVHGTTVWVGFGSRLYVSRDGGLTFARVTDPCSRNRTGEYSPTSISDDGSQTFLLCLDVPGAGSDEKRIYATTRAGGAWQALADVNQPKGLPYAGFTGAIAAGGDGAVVVATAAPGALSCSDDGARQFDRVLFRGTITAWSDLGFTTPRDAVAIATLTRYQGNRIEHSGQLLLSDDGGRTWHATVFRRARPATAPSSRRRRASPSR